MNISTQRTRIDELSSDLTVFFLSKKEALSPAAQRLNQELGGKLQSFIQQEGFSGKKGERLVLSTFNEVPTKRVAIIGLGDKKEIELDTYRYAGGYLAKLIRETKSERVMCALPAAPTKELTTRDISQAIGEGAWLGAYRFQTYKGQKDETTREEKQVTIILCTDDRPMETAAQKGLESARAIADAVLLARDLVNTPSLDMTPEKLVEAAASLEKKGSDITCKVISQDEMKTLGMRAALSIAQGSIHPAVGAHLVYKPKGKVKKKIAIIGKAVTFDSGGLSIKPADGMMTMKIDMAGAATVVGLFQALSILKPNIEVHGIFLAVENMPSGSAIRPGDVVTAMNGTTIEILNTDAEGRVTLADALSYAAELKPDAMIDLATLTGACVVALGDDIAGLMTNDRKLGDRLLDAADDTGEPLWELPMFPGYKELIKSKIADIKNIGGRAASTITAAHFLQYFVKDIPWAHLDIAGPSYAERETRPDLPFGGTGYGVRLLIRYLQALG